MHIGKKKIHLPNFEIGLLRTSHLPPTFAQFIVPLNFNKLDLKDYLLHAYNLKCLSVRSYVIQKRVERIKNLRVSRSEPYRPRAIKKMTVEFEEPFVYPEPPKDLTAWDHEIYKKGKEAQQKRYELSQPNERQKHPDSDERQRLLNIARGMLGLDEDEAMEEVEVEKDLTVD